MAPKDNNGSQPRSGGFDKMDKEAHREIASKGGKAAHQKGTAHKWTSQEAAEAGRKGGLANSKYNSRQNKDAAEDEGDEFNEEDSDSTKRGASSSNLSQ